MWLLEGVFRYVYFHFRPLIKWFMRKMTRMCELQRICYGSQPGYERTYGVEYSLENSRTPSIQKIYGQLIHIASKGIFSAEAGGQKAIQHAIVGIMFVKEIHPEYHSKFVKPFRKCLTHICSYRQLAYDVDYVKNVKFTHENPNHVAKLRLLWQQLMDNENVLTSIKNPEWKSLGFQGDDPGTDFRGMGMLGLDNLVYFSTEYNTIARSVLTHSRHPQYGYPFAIVGINMTSLLHHFLIKGQLKRHMYNAMRDVVGITDFHRLYSYVMVEFDKLWLREKPKDIMEFNRIREKFEDQLIAALAVDSCMLTTLGCTQII